MRSINPVLRFTSRVDHYVSGRPSYPTETVSLLARECRLNPTSRIADVGSGTGLLTRLFLEADYWVTSVEPDAAMRAAADANLAGFRKHASIDARAEATQLPDASIDLITAAQAFHWFEPDAARQEFVRILRQPRWVALIWNERKAAESAFVKEYDALVDHYALESPIVDHAQIRTESVPKFFGHDPYKQACLSHVHSVNWVGFRGRLLSTSRTPNADQPGFQPMMEELKRLYDKYQVDGFVEFPYRTNIYFGKI